MGTLIFGAGIALYFALPFEPSLAALSAMLLIGVCIAWLSYSRGQFWALFLGLTLMILGLWRATLHSDNVAAPILSDRSQAYMVTGWVRAIERSGSGYRVNMRVTEMEKYGETLPDEATPFAVRIKIKGAESLSPGQDIKIFARLSAPPRPVIADGYDPARRAYFDRVGGNGFALGKVQIIETQLPNLSRRWSKTRAAFRARIIRRIQSRAPPETAGLQVALITGERAFIPEEQVEALRVTGLAHILAISGLHMGLVAGGVYWALTLLLASIDVLARRCDVRKISAAVSLLAATLYLVISTGAVSTQRAYVMALIVFLAIIIGRPALSIRSVAVAACVCLWIHPEAIMGAGFHMSFAAVLALVTVYGAWQKYRPPQFRVGLFRRGVNGFTGLSVTSLVAGVATGGFAALHFHHISRYGLIANIAAMPIFSLMVMPLGIISVALMPFGLDGPFLMLMGWGLSKLIAIASYIAAWPGSFISVSGAPPWVLTVYSAGFVTLCLAPRWNKLIGAGIIVFAISAWVAAPLPKLRISETAELTFWETTHAGKIIYGRRLRADGYGRDIFLERMGESGAEITDFKETRAQCDSQACSLTVDGKRISIVREPEFLREECALANLVILTDRPAGPTQRRYCSDKLVDLRGLSKKGALDIYFTKDGFKTKVADPLARQTRPWGQRHY